MKNYASMVQKVNMWRVLDAEEIFCRVIVKGLASDKECLNWFLLSDYYDICERACVKVINDVKVNIRGLGIKDAHRKILIQEEVITELIVRQYYKECPEAYTPLDEIYDKLPETVKRLFVNTDCTLTEVNCIDDSPTVAGVFRHNEHAHYYAIEVKRNTSLTRENVAYHEFGHLLDYGYGESYRSNSKIFIEIYEAEKDSFVMHDDNYEYVTSTPQEYFAEAFAEYMTEPDRLRDNTPMTYDYIEHVLRITDLEEVIYAKQIARNRKVRKVYDDMTEVGENPSSWEKFKLVVRYNWHREETLRGKLQNVCRLIFGR